MKNQMISNYANKRLVIEIKPDVKQAQETLAANASEGEFQS